MNIKTGSKEFNFSFIESLTSEKRDPYQNQHFEQTLDDLTNLEAWMRKREIKNSWTLTEKLAFLRNVESTIRTGAAVRRTQLAWFAVAFATIATVLGFLITIT